LIAVSCLLFIGQFAGAQNSQKRPKVGLVLSGGGSHGIAHIGVIKVMEEAGLRPDVITGTSMGSIIGGFYAMGYSTDSLEKILKAMNWDLLLSNKIPQNKIKFSEKKHFDNSAMTLPVLSKKVRLPSGLISGQQIENSLSFYGWPAANINNFSLLPIPFMCVGVDLVTFRKVDLGTGYLPDALRASSSIPTVFAPLKIDTTLLTDGGVINNFPALEAKNMGADLLIGSYVAFRPYDENHLQSVSNIIEQIGFSRSIDNFNEQKKLVKILISPVVRNISILNFTPVDSIVEIGYKAALPYKEYFRRIADSLDRYGKQEPLPYILNKKYYSFDRIEIRGNSIIPDKEILGVLDIRAGEKVDKYKLYNNIELLYGMNSFEKVKYRIEPRGDSLILAIECTEKPNIIFYGSVHYDNALGSGILISATVKNLLSPGSEFSMDSFIGQYYRALVTFSQYTGGYQKFGISARFNIDDTPIPVLTLKGETGEWESLNLSSGLSFDRIFGLNQMLSLSFDVENRYLRPRYISGIDLKYLSYNYLTSTLNYQVNTLDNRHFPSKGILLNISAGMSDLFSGSTKIANIRTEIDKDSPGEFRIGKFYTLKGNWKKYFPSGKRLTLSLSADILYVNKCDSVTSQNNFFMLGGMTSVNDRSIAMYGFHTNEIAIKQLAGIGMELDWKLLKDLHLTVGANLAEAMEADRNSGYSLLAGYGLGLGYMSILGPIKVGVMHGLYRQEKYFSQIKGYISVGFQL
jgi:Predicted esterase of the alpha-beta hydrolase superfamily